MDFENTSVEMQEVADLAEENIENTNSEVEQTRQEEPENGGNEQEVADPVKNETNARFADARRKQELDRIREENTKLRQQLAYAQQAMGTYFEGSDLTEMSDNAMSQAMGMSIDDYRAQRESRQQAQMENAMRDAELQRYRQKEIDETMDRDLKAIQAIDPTITSLNDIDPMYLALRFNNVQPMTAEEAFIATRETQKQTRMAKPASMGSMRGAGSAESEFFTQREVDRLTSKDLDDPKIMDKVFKSMEHWK